MASSDEEENDIEIPSMNLTPEEINYIVMEHEAEMDRDDKDVESDESGRKRGREEIMEEGDDMLLTQGFTLVQGKSKKRDQRESPPPRDSTRFNKGSEEDNQDAFVEIAVSSKEALPKRIGMAKLFFAIG